MRIRFRGLNMLVVYACRLYKLSMHVAFVLGQTSMMMLAVAVSSMVMNSPSVERLQRT